MDDTVLVVWTIIVVCSVNDGIFAQNEHVRRDYALHECRSSSLQFLCSNCYPLDLSVNKTGDEFGLGNS